MLRSILAGGVCAVALATANPALAQTDSQSTAQATAMPTVDYGTWGVNPASLDPAVDPGDDFFEYVNGKWVAENEIPADKSRYGSFDALNEKSREDVRTLINELVASNPAPGTQERRIVDAYNAFVNTQAIDAAGLAPAQPYLQKIYGANSLNELAMLFEQPGFPSIIGGGVTVDEKNPDAYIPALGFSVMGLPDRDYYLVAVSYTHLTLPTIYSV